MNRAGALLLRVLGLFLPATVAVVRGVLRIVLMLAPLLMLAVAWRALAIVMQSEAGSVRLEKVEFSPLGAPYDVTPTALLQGDAIRARLERTERGQRAPTETLRLRASAETGTDGRTRWHLAEPTGNGRLILRYRFMPDGPSIAIDSNRVLIGNGVDVEIEGRTGLVRFDIQHKDGRLRIEGRDGARGLVAEFDWGRSGLERYDVGNADGAKSAVVDDCRTRSIVMTGLDYVRNLLARDRVTRPIIAIGGQISCRARGEPARLALPELWSGTLAIVETGGDLYLVAGASDEPAAKAAAFGAVITVDGRRTRLATQAWPLFDHRGRQLVRIAFGQTTYSVATHDQLASVGAQALTLTPVARRSWAPIERVLDGWRVAIPEAALARFSGCPGPKEAGASGAGLVLHVACGAPTAASVSALKLAALIATGAAAGLGIALVAAIVRRQRNNSALASKWGHGLFKAGVLGAATALCGLIVANQLVEAAGPLLTAVGLALQPRAAVLATLALWVLTSIAVSLTLAKRLEGLLLWATVTFLAMTGLVALGDLGYAMANERFVEYFFRTLPALALFALGITFGLSVERNRLVARLEAVAYHPRALAGRRFGWPTTDTWLRHAPNLLLWVTLGLWLLFGSAEGINRIVQPSEYVKFGALYALSLMMVICFTFLFSVPAGSTYSFFALGFANLVLGAVLVGVPAIQHDYSPVLIMGLTCLGMCILGGMAGMIAYIVRPRPQPAVRLPLARLGIAIPPNEARWRHRWGGEPGRELAVHVIVLLWWSLRWLVGRGLFVSLVLLSVGVGAFATWQAVDMLTPRGSESGTAARGELMRRHDEARGCSGTGTLCSTKFYGRLVSYVDLALEAEAQGPVEIAYPDEGAQVRRSRRAIATAPCRPPRLEGRFVPLLPGLQRVSAGIEDMLRGIADQTLQRIAPHVCGTQAWPEPRPLGTPIRSELAAIPVIQNDFIGAYLVGRFGHVFAALVAVAQSIVVATAIAVGMAGVRLRRGLVAELARHQLQSLLCIGAGLLLALQWGIAWANVFGLLPVMGQPMTFLAYASSNIVLLALPAVLVILTTIRLDGVNSGTPLISRPRPLASLISDRRSRRRKV